MEIVRESKNYIKDKNKIYRGKIITVEEFDEYQKLLEKRKDDVIWSYKYLASNYIYRWKRFLFWKYKAYDFRYGKIPKPQQIEAGKHIERLVMNFFEEEQERQAITE